MSQRAEREPTIPELQRQVMLDRMHLARVDMIELGFALEKEDKLPALVKRLRSWAVIVSDGMAALREAPHA